MDPCFGREYVFGISSDSFSEYYAGIGRVGVDPIDELLRDTIRVFLAPSGSRGHVRAYENVDFENPSC